MRFADGGYYIEEYVKCANCGVLIYDGGIPVAPGSQDVVCSDWCREWKSQRAAGSDHPVLPLPRS